MEIRDGINLRIEIQPSTYLNKELFLTYVRETFLAAVKSNREPPGCRGKPAVLFGDYCSCHCSDEILWELASHRILLITTHRTRCTYSKFSTFFYLRNLNRQKYIPRDLTQSPVVDHVSHVFQAYEQVTTSTTVRSSWQKTGFGFGSRDETYYRRVDEPKIRSSATFSEVWNIDYPEGGLPARRWQQKQGRLNETIFRVEFHDLAHPAASQE
jgi:hypothetical protein